MKHMKLQFAKWHRHHTTRRIWLRLHTRYRFCTRKNDEQRTSIRHAFVCSTIDFTLSGLSGCAVQIERPRPIILGQGASSLDGPGIVYLQNSVDVPPVGSKLTATWSFKLSRYILGVQPVSPISYFSSETKYPNEDNPVHVSPRTTCVEIFRLKAPTLPDHGSPQPRGTHQFPTIRRLQNYNEAESKNGRHGCRFILRKSWLRVEIFPSSRHTGCRRGTRWANSSAIVGPSVGHPLPVRTDTTKSLRETNMNVGVGLPSHIQIVHFESKTVFDHFKL